MDIHPTLYKRTSAGKVQVWWMEQDDNRYRTCSGQKGGSIVTSEWTIADPKNVGRSNETSGYNQAVSEIESNYKKKLEQGKYFGKIEDIDDETLFIPMLAYAFEPDRLDGRAFAVQPKHNGVRCIIRRDKHGIVRQYSRKGKEFVNTPHISEELTVFFSKHPEAILDGELYNHEYKDKFNSLISSIRKVKPTPETIELSREVVEFHIYDFPSHPGTFFERWEALRELFQTILPENKTIRMSPTYRSTSIDTIKGLHQRNLDAGYEGTIIRLDSKYENKRTYSLMKFKDFVDEEFEILDILEGKGNWSGVGKKVLCKLHKPSTNGKTTFEAGVKGDKEFARQLLMNKHKHIGKLATIVFFEYTEYGVPLFPIYHETRDYE